MCILYYKYPCTRGLLLYNDLLQLQISLSGSRHYESNFSDSHNKRASDLSCVACSNPPLSCVESSQSNQCTRCTIPGLAAATNYTVSVAAVSGAVTGASSSNITGQTMVFSELMSYDA